MNNKILFTGNYSKHNTTCTFIEISKRKRNPKLEEEVEKSWQETLLEAKKEGKKIWDQPVCRLEDLAFNNNKCEFIFSTIPFRIRYPMNNFTDDLLALGKDYYPMGAYTSIFIETQDGKYVFNEKSAKYLSRRKYSFVGGVFNVSSKDNMRRVSIFDAASKEIKEEMNISADMYDIISLIGSFVNETCNVCFVFYLKINLEEKEVHNLFAQQHDSEVEKLIFVEKHKLKSFVLEKIGMNNTILDIFNLAT